MGWWKVREAFPDGVAALQPGCRLGSQGATGAGRGEQATKTKASDMEAQRADAGVGSRAQPQAAESWDLGGRGDELRASCSSRSGGQPAALTPGVTPGPQKVPKTKG